VPARDHPGGQILRGQAAAGRGDIAVRDEGRVQHLDAGLDDPGLGGQVGAGRQRADQAQLGQDQRPRALGADQLAARIELEAREHFGIGGDLARLDPAADQHGVGWAANSSGFWRWMVTPLIDVTSGVGQVMCAAQPLAFMRLSMPSAMNESSSLKPSKVRIAICMVVVVGVWGVCVVRVGGRNTPIVGKSINTIKKLS
jgi:hypothetical protein